MTSTSQDPDEQAPTEDDGAPGSLLMFGAITVGIGIYLALAIRFILPGLDLVGLISGS